MRLPHFPPFQLKAQFRLQCQLAMIRRHTWSVIFFLASVLAWTVLIMSWHLSVTLDWFCLPHKFSVRLSKVTKTRSEQHRWRRLCCWKLYRPSTATRGCESVSEEASKWKKKNPRRSQQTSPPLSIILTAVKMSLHPIFIFAESLRSLSEDTESRRDGGTFHLFIGAVSPWADWIIQNGGVGMKLWDGGLL